MVSERLSQRQREYYDALIAGRMGEINFNLFHRIDANAAKSLIGDDLSHLTHDELHAEAHGGTFLRAVCVGDTDKVMAMLASHEVHVDRPILSSLLPLHVACCYPFEAVVQLLIENGASISAQSPAGDTPLMMSCRYGHPEVVQLLLSKAADPAIANLLTHTPLYEAARLGHLHVVALLLEAGAEPRVRERVDWHSPLHAASAGGHVAVVKLLLEWGADASARSSEGALPITLAKDPTTRAVFLNHHSKGERVGSFFLSTSRMRANGAAPPEPSSLSSSVSSTAPPVVWDAERLAALANAPLYAEGDELEESAVSHLRGHLADPARDPYGEWAEGEEGEEVLESGLGNASLLDLSRQLKREAYSGLLVLSPTAVSATDASFGGERYSRSGGGGGGGNDGEGRPRDGQQDQDSTESYDDDWY